MISKGFRLELEAIASQTLFGNGYLNYGYWEAADGHLSLCALGKAQQAHFERLTTAIPEETRTILDVGSGLGGVAAGLTRRGFAVDCVCPSPRLNALARKNLPPGTRIFECAFEELPTENTYDVVLFSESFHYLDARKALQKIDRHAARRAVILDYFPKEDAREARTSHRQLLALLAEGHRDRLAVAADEDVTKHVVPTFKLLDGLRNDLARPFVLDALAEFRRSHPISAWALSWPLRRLRAKAERTSHRYERFLEKYEYRLIVLAKTAGCGRS